MTIKEDISSSSNNNNNGASQVEEEYDLNLPATAMEEEIIVSADPVATASGYASSSIPSTYSASGQILQPGDTMTTTPAAVAPSLPGVSGSTAAASSSVAAGTPTVTKITQTSADGKTTTTTTTTILPPTFNTDQPPNATVVAGSIVNASASTTPNVRPPPPGVDAGGTWGRGKTIGPTTWGICAVVSCVSCFAIFLPCGLWAFLCPCDQRKMYAVHNKVYDESGRYLGPINRVNFVPLRPYI